MRPGPALIMLAAAIFCLTIFFRLGHLPLLYPDEGRNAEVAREMKESGAWLVPTYNGVDYLDKPAFYFKAVALSLAAFGNNETAARLPSALFALGLVVITFAFCRRVYGPRVAVLASIMVATTPLFFANARTVIFDMALAFFVCGAIFAGYLAEETEGWRRRRWYLLGAASAGLATLVKGPVGMLLPALVLLVFNRVEQRRGAWKRLFAPLNLAVFFIVTLPWFVGLCRAHPDFLHYGLVEETFNRFTSTKKFHRGEPFHFYLWVVAGAFFPWSVLLPEAALAAWQQRWAQHRADRLCLVWAVLVVVFFSVSQSKLPGYILSVTVASGILVARLFDAAFARPDGRAGRLVLRGAKVFGVLCLVVAVAATVGASKVSVLAGPLHISAEDVGKLTPQLAPLAVLMGALGVWALLARMRRSVALGFVGLALFSPAFLVTNLGIFEVVYDVHSSRQLARQLPSLPPDTELASLACYPNGLAFYLGRTMTLITADGGELTSNYILFDLRKRSQNREPWPRNLIPFDGVTRWLAARKAPIFLIVQQHNREPARAILNLPGATVHELSPAYLGVMLPTPGGS